MLHEEKPSLEEALEHHGVKGQRWGVRRQQRRAASQKRDETIKKAREEVEYKYDKIGLARSQRAVARTPAQQAKAQASLEKARTDFQQSDAHKVARRMTKGEKQSLAVLVGVTGVTYTAMMLAFNSLKYSG